MKRLYSKQLNDPGKSRTIGSMFRFLTILGFLMFNLNAEAQIYAPEGLNMPGTWNAWTNPPTNNLAFASSTQVTDGRIELIDVGTTRWQTIFQVAATGGDIAEGTYTWLFTSGPEASAFSNKWSGVTVTLNTLQEYTYQGTTDNSISLSNNHWYTMVWEDAGYENTRAIFMETSSEPIEILTVSNPGAVLPGEAVTITITSGAIPSPEEHVYLRYTTNAWNTSNIIEASMTGTNGTAIILGQSDGTTVQYYVFTSTVFGITEDYDLFTIKLNNNGGNNYEYTVGGGNPAVIDWANLQYPGAGTIVSGSAYDVYAQVYAAGVTDMAGQGADIQAWIGYSITDTDPSTWTNWILAGYSGDVGSNDEYLTDLGAVLSDEGTYYYASRFQYLAQDFVYGGFSESGGGFWDGTTNVSGVLTIEGTPPLPGIDWANLQWPESGSILPEADFIVYAQVFALGITDPAGQGAGIAAWIGYSTEDTDPSGWSNWIVADYSGDVVNNDEYTANLGAALSTEGTYYYASRFQYLDQEFVYGGYSAAGGGFWDGTTNVSGVLTVVGEIVAYPVLFTVTDATGLYSNIKFKGEMTNWEPVDMIQNNHVWTLTLDILPGTYEWGVFEDDGSPDGIWLIIGNNLVVTIGDDGIVTGDISYVVTLVGIDENPLTANIYPNPANDQLVIDLGNEGQQSVVRVINGDGKQMISVTINSSQNVIDLSSLASGMYIVEIVSGQHQVIRQIIKR